MPMALAVLPVLFPDLAERGRAVAVTAISTMLVLLVGPSLVGWLLSFFRLPESLSRSQQES